MASELTMKRIDGVRATLNNCESDWSKQYWSNLLAYLLRIGNRLN